MEQECLLDEKEEMGGENTRAFFEMEPLERELR